MCIVIDANVMGSVLNKYSINHFEFKPILDWVIDGKGKFIYGGTKYMTESGKYLGFFAELKKIRKAVYVENAQVDEKEVWATNQIEHPDFDDPHLIGLLMVSGCKLICSLDERAYPFFQHPIFFSPADRRPKIYSRIRNADLLTEANMSSICMPANKASKKEKEGLTLLQ